MRETQVKQGHSSFSLDLDSLVVELLKVAVKVINPDLAVIDLGLLCFPALGHFDF